MLLQKSSTGIYKHDYNQEYTNDQSYQNRDFTSDRKKIARSQNLKSINKTFFVVLRIFCTVDLWRFSLNLEFPHLRKV